MGEHNLRGDSGSRLARLARIGLSCLLALAVAAPVAAGEVTPGWYQGTASGFGAPTNTAVSSLDVFGSALYAGTWNDAGAQVWRGSGGRQWAPVTPPWDAANSAVSDAQVFGRHLYFGTGNEEGGEIWRTDGVSWQRVVVAGFDDTTNFAVNALGVFNEQLYAATSNLTSGVEVWRSSTGDRGSWQQVNLDGFGGGVTREDVTLGVFAGRLYAGVSRAIGVGGRAELWRSANGTEWQPVFTNGLGYAGNTHVSALAEFQGQGYIGLRNTVTGGQLWRSPDGQNWSPVFTDGLGTQANGWLHGLQVHDSRLYLLFGNFATGAEVWRSSDGAHWAPMAQGGWGDPLNGAANYFNKAAVVFHGVLTLGTVNETTGGQVWRQGALNLLPLVRR